MAPRPAPMTALPRALACALVMSALPSCPTPVVEERPPVSLALQFVARQSCGRISALDYDTSCAHAIQVRVLSESRTEIYERCIELDEAPADLGELLQGEPLLSFGGLSTNKSVYFEVRAFHAIGLDDATSASLCTNSAQKDYWLFWGESELVDLRAYDTSTPPSPLIPIVVDCRDCAKTCEGGECFGCLAISSEAGAQCPAVFPQSVCAPSSVAMCGIPCDDDEDCFDGAQRCIDNTCDTADTGGTLCSRCTEDGPPCLAGLSCVARLDQTVGVCAPPCPDTTCVTGTKCTRIGNGIEILDAPLGQ